MTHLFYAVVGLGNTNRQALRTSPVIQHGWSARPSAGNVLLARVRLALTLTPWVAAASESSSGRWSDAPCSRWRRRRRSSVPRSPPPQIMRPEIIDVGLLRQLLDFFCPNVSGSRFGVCAAREHEIGDRLTWPSPFLAVPCASIGGIFSGQLVFMVRPDLTNDGNGHGCERDEIRALVDGRLPPFADLKRLDPLDAAYAPPAPVGHYDFAPGQEMQHDTSPHRVSIGGVEQGRARVAAGPAT
jgi:hypothetical protein